MVIQLASFNTRGLRDQVKRRKIFKKFREEKYDVVFLQETHSLDKDVPFWVKEWGGESFYSNFSGNSRGVAILFKKGLTISTSQVLRDTEGRYIILEVEIGDFKCVLANVYGPNEDLPAFYVNFFSDLNETQHHQKIIAGDFNLVLGPLDYHGQQVRHQNKHSRDILLEFMEVFDLVDVWREQHPEDKKYSRQQAIPRCLSRIDCFF